MAFLEEIITSHKYIGESSSNFAVCTYEGYQKLDELHDFEDTQDADTIVEKLNMTYDGGTFMPFHAISYAVS